MLSPLLSTAEFLKRIILISLPQQTKSSKRIHVSSGQRSETGTFKTLSPFHIQTICLNGNLGCPSSDMIPLNMRMTVLFNCIMVYNFSLGKLFSTARYKPRWLKKKKKKRLCICQCLKCRLFQCISQ